MLEATARVRWGGGQFTLNGAAAPTADGERLTDHCFALVVDGRVIAAGAVLVPYSARLLRFPVLQVLPRRPGRGLELKLAPQFPANAVSPIPQAWRDAFTERR